MEPTAIPEQQRAARRPLWWLSISFNILLFVAVCALGLYAFMLNVDLGDIKRRLSKQVESREQTERYLVETRNLLAQTSTNLSRSAPSSIFAKPSSRRSTRKSRECRWWWAFAHR
jgi:hypothetical protein